MKIYKNNIYEYSFNNSLKVIHSDIEYDLNDGGKKNNFIGISYCHLHATKNE